MGVLVDGKDQETESRVGAGLSQTGLTGLVLKAGQMITGLCWPSKDGGAKLLQSCLTLCDHHGILQARILEWVSFPFSREYSQPRDGTQVSQDRKSVV